MKGRPPVVIIRKRSGDGAKSEGKGRARRGSGRTPRGESAGKPAEAPRARRDDDRARKPRKDSASPVKPTPAAKTSRGRDDQRRRPSPKQSVRDSEKLARRKAAAELAESAGIPVAYAHRILQGQTTLKDVTQKLMRKAKLQALIRDEALDPSLAGQVAAGKLKLERARIINQMRKLRPHSVSKDGFHLAGEVDGSVAVKCFGTSWLVGKVTNSDIYEVDFQVTETGHVQRLVKHDVKMIVLDGECALDELIGIDQDVAAQGLEGTGEVTQRIKLPESHLLDAIESKEPLRLICRDGSTVRGRVVCFSRWDVELSVTPLTGGEPVSVIVFNHALHPKSSASAS